MADRQLNILLKASDQTASAVRSASANLQSLGKTAAGTALGLFGYKGITSIFEGLASSTIGMNQSLDATKRSAVSMLDSIRTSTGGTEKAFAGSATQITNWGRQLREIREREQSGIADFADKTKQLNDELTDLLSGKNIAKRARDEKEALDDLAQSHGKTIAELQDQVTQEQSKGIYVDGVLFQQGNKKRIAQLEDRIADENKNYQDQLARRKREYDEAYNDLKESNDKRIGEIRRSLVQESADQIKFVRDIKEAYVDLENAKKAALAGGGGGGLGQGTGAVITYRAELQKLKATSAEVFAQFDKFFKEEGIRSPFSIPDIQRAGTQLIQFSGGSLKNMQQIVQMAESLASSPAVANFSSAERMDLAIRALSEAYNGQFTSMQRIFNISGAGFDALQKGTFTTTQFTRGLSDSLAKTGINYGLVDQYSRTLDGSWGNLTETANLLLATISSPVYDWLTAKLTDINTWVNNNQVSINAWASDLKVKVADFLDREVKPRFDAFVAWLQSDQAKKDMKSWTDQLWGIADALSKIVMFGGKVSDTFSKIGGDKNSPTGLGGSAGKATNNFLSPLLKALWYSDGTSNHPGGWAVVGEKGPELLNLPRGSQVASHSQSQQMMSGGGQSFVFNNYGDMKSDLDIRGAMREFGFMVTR